MNTLSESFKPEISLFYSILMFISRGNIMLISSEHEKGHNLDTKFSKISVQTGLCLRLVHTCNYFLLVWLSTGSNCDALDIQTYTSIFCFLQVDTKL